MKTLILHPTTGDQVEQFVARPTHALLLTGPAGIGKTAVAELIAEKLLGTDPATHPQCFTIRPEGATISIDAIRQLQKFLQLRTAGEQLIRRVVLLEHAHTLTIEAQNAFLKLLEEPPADTVIILTAHSPRALLPTVLSRVQIIAITAPAESQLQSLMQASGKSAEIQRQSWFLSDGLPGLLQALLYEADHPLLESIDQAKTVLQKQTFERLTMVDGLSKQKDAVVGMVEALERIAQAGLTGAAAKQDTTRIKQWHHVRKLSLQAQKALHQSANTKLVLTNLFLNLN